MDEISSKYVLIAVGIFVTIIVLTSVLMAFNKTQEVYGLVKNTNISIKSRIDNIYAQYDGAKLNGVDLLNTMKKYGKDDKDGNEDGVLVEYTGQGEFNGTDTNTIRYKAEHCSPAKKEIEYLEELFENGTEPYFKYYNFYSVKVTEASGVYTITFGETLRAYSE